MSMTPTTLRGCDADFAKEKLSDELFEEALPLLRAHYQEIHRFKDIPMDIDFECYKAAEFAGLVRCFTARRQGRLVGYSSYFVRNHPHFKSSVQALNDVLYVSPTDRGFGALFLSWCEAQLRSEGIQEVYQSVTERYNFGPMLERMGYTKLDTTYTRRLD